MRHVIRFLLRHRRAALVLVLLSLGISGLAARQIQIRFQYRDFYDYPGNPDMPLLSRYNDDFGDPAGFVVMLIEADDVFRKEVLSYVQTITRELEPEPLFSHVHSLTNAKATFGKGDDVTSGVLMAELPATPEETERVRDVAVHSSLLVRRVVSADSQATVILAEMRTPAATASIAEQKQAVAAVRAVLARHPAPANVRLRVTGAPVSEVETTDGLIKDMLLLTPASILVITLALFLIFRSAQGIVLPLAAVTVSVLWTAGIFSLLHQPVDIVGSTMPATLLVYGVVDPIFVLSRFLQKLELGRTREDAIVEAQGELALPCFLTSLTTALGFASFATATLPTVKRFGITAAIGVSLSWVTTVLVLPLLLSWLPPPKVAVAKLKSSLWLDRRLAGLWHLMRPRVGWVIVSATALLVGGAVVTSGMHISNRYVGNTPKGETLDAIHVLERKLSGIIRTVVYFEGEPGSMKRPEVLRAIAAVDRFAESLPLINSSVSLADLVAEENQAFHGGDPAAHVVPDSKALIAQYLALLDPADRSDFVDGSYSRSHLRILTTDDGSETFRAMRAALEKKIAEEHFDQLGVRTSLTGTSTVAFHALDQIVVEVVLGFVLAFAIVVAFVTILFRSVRIALISIAPNLLPVVAAFAFMRLMHINLRMDSSLFLSVCVGGLFNTTIHLAARIRLGVKSGERDPDRIMQDTLRAVGPPALFTAAILSFGFANFMLSGFPGLRQFGMVSMVTLMVGFFSDMIFSAALFRRFFGWKGALASGGDQQHARTAKEGS